MNRYPTLAARLEANSVAVSCGCRLWLGRVNNDGYPVFTQRVNGKPVPQYAHRASWSIANNQPVPAGMHVDHLCVDTRCIAEAHLEVVTPAVNQARKVQRRKAAQRRADAAATRH